jgi:glucosamine--fructose-6-phosphate aminotransferase (isomerizing)
LEKIVDLSQSEGAGIAHTRWATHGSVTVENAHPHRAPSEDVVLVHNGIIENYSTLKERLEDSGAVFVSQTDSEVIAHLVSNLYNGKSAFGDAEQSPETKGDPLESIRRALRFTRGTWGVAVMFADKPNEIFAARNGSPLVIGIDGPSMYLASDPHAITPHTRQVIFLNDGDLAHIYEGDVEIYRLDGGFGESELQVLEDDWGTGEKGDYPHFMLKEIYEQPEALRQCIRGRLDYEMGTAKLGGLDLEPQVLHSINQVTLLGCGTAYYASSVGAAVIEKLARIPSASQISSEYRHRNPVISPNELFFAVTQSGETADTLGALKEVQLKGGTAMGVVNVVGSTIARRCGRGVYIHSGPEMSVASTKAFSNMVAALTLFAL